MGTSDNGSGNLTNQQRILLALDDAVKKLETLEREKTEPIAIVGMGCRFPGGANDPDAFWQLLQAGTDAITEVPRERWNLEDYYDPDPTVPGKTYTRCGGFLDQIDQFDPQFFGISPREALNMDPQQRLLLEVAWEAMERAGSMPNLQQPRKAGVFVGVTTNDYARFITQGGDLTQVDAYYLTGNPLNAIAGRLAYTFGLQGPCMAVDTACSSSLVAVHLAAQSLRNGECDSALAGGVNLILSPENTVALSKAQMLSTDGRCKTFDASADGIVRGEGCGVIVLKRLSDAQADGDNILATIRGSAVNQDGRSSGFTVPNKSAQQALIQQALNGANMPPSAIDYVEAHGTGTPLGDPIELRALAEVLGNHRSVEKPLLIGSVKTNFGHLESAAGIAGLIKVVLSMQHETIPPHLHFREPNPHISWADLPIQVTAETTIWERNGKPRAAGISSFGASGTNAHVVLEEAPSMLAEKPNHDRPLQLLTLSAKSPEALRQLQESYAIYLEANPNLSIQDICFSANTGRSHLEHRMGILASSSEQLQRLLASSVPEADDIGVFQGTSDNTTPSIAFLFTGQGSQYWGMGRELYETQPQFRDSLTRCDELLKPILDRSLLELLFGSADATAALNQTTYTQPALFAIEYALAQLWLSWGIRPSVVMGHSVGEYVAACIAGVFSLEDGLKLIAERGRLMQALPSGGGMVSVLATEPVVNRVIVDFPEISIAAINGPQSIVISGPQADLDSAIARMQHEDIKVKPLAVSHAFHSAQMEPMLASFRRVAEQISYREPQLTVISNVTGTTIGAEMATADYLCRHVRLPVQFYKGMQSLVQLNPDAYLELGPKPVLLGMGRQCIDAESSLWLPSLRPAQSDWQALLNSLAQLYVVGASVDWARVDSDYSMQRVDLPSYPFQRQRYWVEQSRSLPELTPASFSSFGIAHPLIGQRLSLPGLSDVRFTSQLNTVQNPYLQDHCIYQRVVVPATAYLEMALAAGQQALKQQPLALTSVTIQQPMVLSDKQSKTVHVVLTPATDEDRDYRFEIFSLNDVRDDDPVWTCHASGQIEAVEPLEAGQIDLAQLEQQYGPPISVTSLYQGLAAQGMAYGPTFQGIQQVLPAEAGALGQVALDQDVETTGYCFHPALLDACFQVLGVLMPPDGDAAYLPVAIERLSVSGPITGPLWSQVEMLSEESSPQQIAANIHLFDETGQLVAQLQGLSLKRVPQSVLQRVLQDNVEDWLYRVDWQPLPQPSPQDPAAADHWLIFADGADSHICQQFDSAGIRYTLVTAGAAFEQTSESHCQFDLTQAEHYAQLLDTLPSIQGIVHACGISPIKPATLSLATVLQSQQTGCGSVLHLTQALIEGGRTLPRGLWLLTCGANAVGTASAALQPQQSSLWGLGRVIALEHPELSCRCLDLDPATAFPALVDELYSADADNQIAYRNGQRFGARLVRYGQEALTSEKADAQKLSGKPFQVRIGDYGLFETLQAVPMVRQAPGPGEVEIQVRAVGLNFRDVLNALGMLKSVTEAMGITDTNNLPFGGECSGVIAAVGEDVTELKVGDPVIAAQTIGSLSSFVNVPADFVVSKPESLSFEEAATIPTAFLTAYYALNERAQLKAGERVLIHSAAGGVGQAAVQVANWLGASVLGTASQPKWDALRAMGVEHVFNSRTTEFSQQVLDATAGKGVDVVLNSLNGEFIPSSLSALTQQGRFVEIGKLGIWTDKQMADERPDVRYEPFDLLDISLDDTAAIHQLLTGLMPLFESEDLNPLNLVCFPIEEMADAFRFMAQAKHIGKVVISLPEPTDAALNVEPTGAEEALSTFEVNQNGTYLITGGLGALGLQVASWLVDRGAKQLALIGRSEPSQQATEAVDALKQSGATVQVLRADVADAEQLAGAIRQVSHSLKGIFHTAGVLDDAILSGQSWGRFERVMQPKVAGTWLLHELTADKNLDCFVCFSSVSALVGSPGQANYAAANSFMDGFAHYRRSLGLKGLSINWGPWANSGMAAALHSRNQARWAAQGVNLIDPSQGVTLMAQLLDQSSFAQAAVLPVDWRTYLVQIPPGLKTSFLEYFQHQSAACSQTPTLLLELQAAAPHERLALLSQQMQSLIAKVLGLSSPEAVQPRQRLFDMGIDSLMAVELKSRLEAALACQLRSTLIFDYPTLEALVNHLATEVLALDTEEAVKHESQTSTGNEDDPSTDSMTAEVADLTEAEAEELLLAELNKVSRSIAS